MSCPIGKPSAGGVHVEGGSRAAHCRASTKAGAHFTGLTVAEYNSKDGGVVSDRTVHMKPVRRVKGLLFDLV